MSVPVVQAKIGKRSTITGPGSESEAGLILHKIIESFDADRQNTAHVLAMRASLAMKSGQAATALTTRIWDRL